MVMPMSWHPLNELLALVIAQLERKTGRHLSAPRTTVSAQGGESATTIETYLGDLDGTDTTAVNVPNVFPVGTESADYPAVLEPVSRTDDAEGIAVSHDARSFG